MFDRANLKQTRTSLYCHILSNHNSENENDYLRRLFLKNCPVKPPAEVPGALEMIASLARFQKLAKPEEANRDSIDEADSYSDATKLIDAYRDLNRYIYLQNERNQLAKIHEPDSFVLDKIAFLNKEMAAIQANAGMLFLNDDYPAGIVAKAKEFEISQTSTSPYCVMTSRNLLDAFRANDFVAFVQLADSFILKKYNGVISEVAAEEISTLLPHELAKAGFNLDDMRRLNAYIEMSMKIGSSSGPFAYFCLPLNINGQALLASQQVFDNAFDPSREIRNKDEYKEFAKFYREQNNEDNLRKVNQNFPQIQRDIAAGLNVDQFVDEHKQGYYTSVIIHLLRTVKIQEVNQQIRNYIADESMAEFKQQLLQFQLTNAKLVKEWQIQLYDAVSDEQEKKKLKYAELLALRAYEKERILHDNLPKDHKKYLQERFNLDKLGYEVKHPLSLNENVFQKSILPKLKRQATEMALAQAKEQLKPVRNQITKDLIHNIKDLIQNTDWKVVHVFGLGMKKIPVVRNGVEIDIIVPKNVYKIYELCVEAERNPESDFNAVYREIQSTARKASSNMFTLFRYKETQQFYENLKNSSFEPPVEQKYPKA